MKAIYLSLIGLLLITSTLRSQNDTTSSPCSNDAIIARHLEINPNALIEMEENELFIKEFIEQLKENRSLINTDYTIPVVLHVFHNGDDGMIDMEQAQSGIDIINRDFNGLNDDWNDIDPDFADIKATLNMEFCLASIDPDGNPTSGVIYYDDEQAMLNIPDLFEYAWDNFKYLNIYLPKYTNGAPSEFTAYAYFPNIFNTENNRDGIFYSSIRWGYGTHSEHPPGAEWASVGTHEVGHWLNLYHTFSGGCSTPGDYINDTPPTLGGTIELSGCNNNDFSCGVATNGENYMDYNHDCKKMFTQGQVDRMLAALNLPSRITLWSPSNLEATGCAIAPTNLSEVPINNSVLVYPNPANDYINFEFNKPTSRLTIFNAQGILIFEESINDSAFKLNTKRFAGGLYFYYSTHENKSSNGKFIIN